MEYISTSIPDSLSVKGIFTVLRPELSKSNTGKGESHNFPEIIYVSRGRHTILIDGTEYTLGSGEMIIYAPGAHHKSKSASSAEASIISFETDSQTLPVIYNRKILLTQSQRRIFSGIIEDALRCFKRRAPNSEIGGMILKDGVEEYTLQKIKKQLEFFLIDIYKSYAERTPEKKEGSKLRDFETVVSFLENNLDRSLSLAEIAEACSMSVSKLKILFRENNSGGAINYFIELKIEEAKRMIKEGKLNFTEISEALGFNSLHYFSRLFKKITGSSPSEYAKTPSV